MPTTQLIGLYTGPRPSPARRWAPSVIAVSAVLVICNVVMLVLNLVERGYQQQRVSGSPPSPERIREALDSLHTVGHVSEVAALAFLVLGVIWSAKRRTRARAAREGETGVETRLRSVKPSVYWSCWAALGASVFLALSARSMVHVGMTAEDFVGYRSNLAAANGARALMWAGWVALVIYATKFQDRREAAAESSGDAVSVAPLEVSSTEATGPADFGSKTWHKVAIGLLVGFGTIFVLLIVIAETT
jgi:hypothetical protein